MSCRAVGDDDVEHGALALLHRPGRGALDLGDADEELADLGRAEVGVAGAVAARPERQQVADGLRCRGPSANCLAAVAMIGASLLDSVATSGHPHSLHPDEQGVDRLAAVDDDDLELGAVVLERPPRRRRRGRRSASAPDDEGDELAAGRQQPVEHLAGRRGDVGAEEGDVAVDDAEHVARVARRRPR